MNIEESFYARNCTCQDELRYRPLVLRGPPLLGQRPWRVRWPFMSGEVHDLGNGHSYWFVSWDPDLELNPQYEHLRSQLPVERWGLIERHPAKTRTARTSPSGFCEGAITFDGPIQQLIAPNVPRWTVESWDPLTLSPSLLCNPAKGGCGNHGFIREGRWVDA